MISEVSLEGFQGFGQREVAPLRRLTLIFGPNASGKSSITRALLLLKQSLPSSLSLYNSPAGITYNGPDISLAGFANVVFKHDQESRMKIGLTFDRLDALADLSSRLQPTMEAVSSVKVEFVVSKNNSFDEIWLTFELRAPHTPIILRFLKRKDSEFSAFSGELVDGEKSLDVIYDANIADQNAGAEGQTDLSKSGTNLWREYFKKAEFRIRGNFPSTFSRRDDADSDEGNTEPMRQALESLLAIARSSSMRHFRNFKSIGPLRKIADRLEYSAGPANDEDDKTPSIDELKRQNAKVSEWLLRLTNGRYKFEPVEFQVGLASFLGSLKSQIVVDTATDTPVTFSDVGVGLSQIVPILQALYSPAAARGRARPSIPETLTIEQPELHLHPAMQADLAELFVDAIKSRSSLQIVAETHSESLLLRIQKLLRQGTISKEDVQILYVDRAPVSEDGLNNGNIISVLEINEADDFSISMPQSFTRLRLDELL